MTTEKAYENINDLSDDFAAVRNEIAKLTTIVTDLVKGQASSAASTVVDTVDQARQKVAETASDAQYRLKSATGDIEASIERNPVTAVMIALVAGVFVGLLTRSAK
jgi:ElaB/YqjD/DUF883 family membrane-anchored ribosome-binding protein